MPDCSTPSGKTEKGKCMKVFETRGTANTEETVRIAVTYAREHDLPIVAATTTGTTVKVLLDEIKEQNYAGKITAVTHAYGAKVPNENELSEEDRAMFIEKGITVVTAAHALSAGERGMSSVFKGVYPLEIVAHTLRMFGAGTKVCVECATMAADSGNVRTGEPCVCIGGTGRGADTCLILLPAPSSKLFETKICEFLCKPGMMQ